MKIIKPSVEIMSKFSGLEVAKHIELCGRSCYNSCDLITEDSYKSFLKSILRKEHESVVEHFSVTVKFTGSRGFSHQLVRHRIASYSQQSMRYCNFSRSKFGSEIKFIKPPKIQRNTQEFVIWQKQVEGAERAYMELIDIRIKAQDARSVLPICTATEVIVSMNLRSWRHYLRLRSDKHTQDEHRILAQDLLDQFKAEIPVIFEDL